MTSKGFERLMRAAGAAAAKVRRRHLPSLGPTSIIVSLELDRARCARSLDRRSPGTEAQPREADAAADRRGVGKKMTGRQGPPKEMTPKCRIDRLLTVVLERDVTPPGTCWAHHRGPERAGAEWLYSGPQEAVGGMREAEEGGEDQRSRPAPRRPRIEV